MQTKTCPECGDDIYVNAKSHKCGWRLGAGPKVLPRVHRMGIDEKAAYESGGPRSHDLTEQQWYNVCKFWPSVARRCSRQFADVGPHNPLDATSRLGPLMRRIRPPEVVEREPGQEG